MPTALSGYRPRVSATSSLTEQYLDTLTKSTTPAGTPVYTRSAGNVAVSAVGATATQTLFNGFQTANRTRQAEGQVFAARETLRTTEQAVLLNAVTAYMNLLRDAATLELQRSNVNVLEVTLRQTRDRFSAGEVTRTDVAQAESRLAGGRSQLSVAESNYVTSRANYRQVIGVDPPARLTPAMPVDRLSPRTLDGAVARGRTEHPLITTAMYNVDVAQMQVKVAEGALYPTVSVIGNVQKTFGSTSSLAVIEIAGGLGGGPGLGADLSGRRRILDHPAVQGDCSGSGGSISIPRATWSSSTVTQAWGQLDAAKAQIDSSTAQVDGGRDRAQRRARRGPRRPAHHARCAQRPAGSGQCARRPGQRAARPGRGVVHGAGGDRRAVAAGPGAENRALRPGRALSSGARRMGRGARPGRALIGLRGRCGAQAVHMVHKTLLASIFEMPYSFHFGR